jgi:ribosomal protein S1
LKQLAADPWSSAAETYQPGQLRTGRITRVADFGVFVELEPGVEALIPVSEIGAARDTDLRKAFPVGHTLEAVVAEVDAAARRMRLSLTAVQKMREAAEMREYSARTEATPATGFGSTLADKLRSALKPRDEK